MYVLVRIFRILVEKWTRQCPRRMRQPLLLLLREQPATIFGENTTAYARWCADDDDGGIPPAQGHRFRPVQETDEGLESIPAGAHPRFATASDNGNQDRNPYFPHVDLTNLHHAHPDDRDEVKIPASHPHTYAHVGGSGQNERSRLHMDAGRSPFRNATLPGNPYNDQPVMQTCTSVDESAQDVWLGSSGVGRTLVVDDEEEESLGGEIISPRNAD